MTFLLIKWLCFEKLIQMNIIFSWVRKQHWPFSDFSVCHMPSFIMYRFDSNSELFGGFFGLFFNIYVFIWLCWVLVMVCGSSLHHVWPFLFFKLWHRDSLVLALGLSSCHTWVPEHVGSVAPQHVKSYPTRDQTSTLFITSEFLTTGPPGRLRPQKCLSHSPEGGSSKAKALAE